LDRGDLTRDWSASPGGVAYLLIDCSGSMAGEKLEQARAGALRYAEKAVAQQHSVGIISFGGTAALVLSAGLSVDAVNGAMETLVAGGRTNLHLALALAIAQTEAQLSRRTVVVITDGKPDDHDAALREGNRAKGAGITIVTIGTHDADNAFLRELASREEMNIETSDLRLADAMAAAALLLPASEFRD
jgi:Mg-chelatase subunit ChlD